MVTASVVKPSGCDAEAAVVLEVAATLAVTVCAAVSGSGIVPE